MNNNEYESHLIARFTNFVKIVSKHAKIDFIRKNERYKNEVLYGGLSGGDPVNFDDQFEKLRTPRDSFEFEEERLAKAIQQMPLIRQDVLRYTFIYEMSTNEIAAKLGCSVSYVRVVRHRAIEKIREMLEQGEFEL